MFHILRTYAQDGTNLAHLPTAERIVESGENYAELAARSQTQRIMRYTHKVTGEVRDYSDRETGGCAYADDLTVWRFVRSSNSTPLGYTIVVKDADLGHFEPPAKAV